MVDVEVLECGEGGGGGGGGGGGRVGREGEGEGEEEEKGEEFSYNMMLVSRSPTWYGTQKVNDWE